MVLSGGGLANLPASTCQRVLVRQKPVSLTRTIVYRRRQVLRPQKEQLKCRAYADSADPFSGLDEADDFYSILGVVRLLL